MTQQLNLPLDAPKPVYKNETCRVFETDEGTYEIRLRSDESLVCDPSFVRNVHWAMSIANEVNFWKMAEELELMNDFKESFQEGY